MPPPPSHPYKVSCADFVPYLAAIADPFARFADIHLHASTKFAASDVEDALVSSGLAACVPVLFFKEDFALEDRPTFKAACPLDDYALQHLDMVEAHLVQEIARRSESFYEARVGRGSGGQLGWARVMSVGFFFI